MSEQKRYLIVYCDKEVLGMFDSEKELVARLKEISLLYCSSRLRVYTVSSCSEVEYVHDVKFIRRRNY